MAKKQTFSEKTGRVKASMGKHEGEDVLSVVKVVSFERNGKKFQIRSRMQKVTAKNQAEIFGAG